MALPPQLCSRRLRSEAWHVARSHRESAMLHKGSHQRFERLPEECIMGARLPPASSHLNGWLAIKCYLLQCAHQRLREERSLVSGCFASSRPAGRSTKARCHHCQFGNQCLRKRSLDKNDPSTARLFSILCIFSPSIEPVRRISGSQR